MYVDSGLKVVSYTALPLGMLQCVLRMIEGTCRMMYLRTMSEMVGLICRYIGWCYTILSPRDKAREIVLHRIGW